jgi:membrane protease YdiL (CAAX protease family)
LRRIAHPLHTVVLLAAQGFLLARGIAHANQMRAAVDANRAAMYTKTIIIDWLLLAFVILGVWLAGSPLSSVLGQRWRSGREVLRDISIGVGFMIVQTLLLSGISAHLGNADSDRAVRFLLPHGPVEMALWVALSLTAGICEESLYRGYLQRQFTALSRHVAGGILLSAVVFAVAHSYQGFWRAVVIGLDGATLGWLAHWRRSVRPGMVAHSLKDVLAVVLMGGIKH